MSVIVNRAGEDFSLVHKPRGQRRPAANGKFFIEAIRAGGYFLITWSAARDADLQMIKDTIKEIEERLAGTGIPVERREQLLALLGTLKREVEDLARTRDEEARSIAGFTNISAQEATRQEKNPELLKLSLDGLATSVRGLEESHPNLVEIVNRIATTLSNLGI